MRELLRTSTNTMIAVIIAGASLIAWALIDSGIERISARAALASRGAGASLASTLAKSQAHLLSLASEDAIRLVLNADGDADKEALTPMIPAFTTLLSRNPTYRQARWIDESGRERLRVVRGPDGAIRVDHGLQDKSSRYYVQVGLATRPGVVGVSRLDLNVENGEIEEPWVPTLRFMIRVTDDMDAPSGLLVVNLDMREILAAIDRAVRDDGINLSLLNQRGEWLLSPVPGDAFAFMEGRDVTLAARSPALWRRIVASPSGRSTSSGISAWSTIDPLPDARAPADRDNRTPWIVLTQLDQGEVTALYVRVLLPTSLVTLLLLGLFVWMARRIEHREHALVTARLRAEDLSKATWLVSEIAKAANAAMTPAEMVYLSLRPLCVATGIGVGVAVFGDTIGMHYIDSSDDPSAVGGALRALEVSSWLDNLRRVKEPTWLDLDAVPPESDASNDWQRTAAEAGLVGALGIPIVVDGEVLARCVLLYGPLHRLRKEGLATIVEVGAGSLSAEVRNVVMREAATAALDDARREAEAANRAKTEFLAHISHELRTPLNGVIGAARLMRGGLRPEERRKFLGVIEQSGRHLLALINKILDAGKIESGGLDLVDSDFDLVEVIESALLGIESLAEVKGIRLVNLTEPSITGLFRGDPTRLTQVITNLAGNALKFTDVGKIVIRVRELEDSTPTLAHLEIAVEDSGRGIDEANLDRIFGRYAQEGAKDGAGRPEGIGLGLHISRLLVARMGGTIAAESPNPNNRYDTRGARFVCALKLRRVSGPRPSGESVERFASAWIVDEDAELGEHLCELAAGWGVAAVHHERWPPASETLPAVILHNASLAPPARFAALAREYFEPVVRRDLSAKLSAGAAERDARSGDEAVLAERLCAANHERPRRLLIAEDNLINQLVLRTLLERLGFAVDVVDNGRDVLTRFEGPDDGSHPECVLMDSNMPGMGGIEAARRLRASGVTVPIIAVTADAMADEVQRCIDAGMDDFVTKPVDLERLAVALSRRVIGDAAGPSPTSSVPAA